MEANGWVNAVRICCVLVLPVIASAGLLINPLPSSSKLSTGQYDGNFGELNTTFIDGKVSVTIVNSTELVVKNETNSSSLHQISNEEALAFGVPEQQNITPILSRRTDDMDEAASFFRPRGFGGYGGRIRSWSSGWRRRRPWTYGGYGGYGGYYW